jgi:integrase
MKLLQRLDEKLIQKGSPRTTRDTYGHWVEKYFRHILKLHGRDVTPEKMGAKDVEEWLTHLAVREHLAPSTQNVALQAVLFLYREILGIDLKGIDALRSRKPKLMPVVLNLTELGMMFEELQGIPLLIAKIQTGCGLRIGEAVASFFKTSYNDTKRDWRLVVKILMGRHVGQIRLRRSLTGTPTRMFYPPRLASRLLTCQGF